jgi:hypothetical protein
MQLSKHVFKRACGRLLLKFQNALTSFHYFSLSQNKLHVHACFSTHTDTSLHALIVASSTYIHVLHTQASGTSTAASSPPLQPVPLSAPQLQTKKTTPEAPQPSKLPSFNVRPQQTSLATSPKPEKPQPPKITSSPPISVLTQTQPPTSLAPSPPSEKRQPPKMPQLPQFSVPPSMYQPSIMSASLAISPYTSVAATATLKTAKPSTSSSGGALPSAKKP